MKKIAIVATLIVLNLSPLFAGIITTVNADAQWNPMVTPNRDRRPFWDNRSGDGDRLVGQTQGGGNIGYYLTGNFGITQEGNAGPSTIFTPGGLSAALGQNVADWNYLSTISTPYANPTQTGPAGFYLQGGYQYDFSFLGGVTGMPNSVMGYYLLSNPGILIPLFTGHTDSGVETIIATEAIGIYFKPAWSATTFRSTDTNLNLGSVISPGIAVFQMDDGGSAPGWGSVLLGFEDVLRQFSPPDNRYIGDNDYNDMMIGLKCSQVVPEPETWAMLGVSIAIGAVMIRKRQRRRMRLEMANSKGYYFGLPR